MKKHSWKKIGCLFLAMLMMATMLATGVVAYDNNVDQETGSITIHKYEQRDDGSEFPDPNAEHGSGMPITDTTGFGEPLEGVEFTIWNVTGKYTGNEEAAEVDTSNLSGGITQITDAQGEAVFSNLQLGVYLVKETKGDPHTTHFTKQFFVSIPMTNPQGDGWIYNVHVYPKNALVRGDVTLNKVGEDNKTALADATFALYTAKQNENNEYTVLGDLFTGAKPGKPSTEEPYNSNAYTVSDSTGKVSFTDIPAGHYILKEVDAPDGYTLSNVTYPFEITAANWHATFEANAVNYLQLTNDDLTKKYTGYEGALDINWQVTAKIPGDIELYKTFTLTDNVPDGLADAKNILVKVGDKTLTAPQDFTLTNPSDDESNDFTINFTNKAALKGYDNVVITFTTAITNKATVGQVTNSVTLTYQSETGKEGTLTAQDKANIYGITINKVNLAGDKLPGATFDLYYGDNEPTPGTGTPVYTDLSTNEEGILTFQGLNPGTYWLVETKAPDGYKVMAKAFKVVIDEKDPKKELGYAEEVTILNTANVSLPITGGIGTLIFTFSGIALMGAAVLLYIRSRRKSSAQA